MNSPANSPAPSAAGVVTVSRTFNAPVERVWEALTSVDAICQWMFPVSGFKPEVGFQFEFVCEDQGTNFVHHCRVTQAVPHKLLAYTWRYSGFEGDSLVTIALSTEGQQTKVTLTHTGLDTFPKVPSFARNNFEMGWTELVGRSLKEFVEKSASDAADREIVITRLVSAPRELVWRAFTDPQHITNWWGPRGFTTTTHSLDLKPGGIWRYTMHGPDGRDYPNLMTYHEVQAPERLAYTHGDGQANDPNQFETVITFTAEASQTRIVLRSVFKTAAARDYVVKEYGAIEGGIQMLDRFEEQVAFAAAPEPFVLSRTFNAPRETVWKALTEADRLMKWWGPTGFAMDKATVDLRPGGTYHYGMSGPGGMIIWGKFTYREVVPPEKLVFILQFSDEQGGLVRHPMHGEWPLKMLKTITLKEEGGKTTLTLTGVPFNATESEQKTYLEGHGSLRQGFGGTWDRLDEYLSKI